MALFFIMPQKPATVGQSGSLWLEWWRESSYCPFQALDGDVGRRLTAGQQL